ncbi:MAG: RNA-binding transcriptional accessory protein [Myxococcales bacterium]|nr:RNA-binding transcriptional accessory protein [Myxococcales bacterium]
MSTTLRVLEPSFVSHIAAELSCKPAAVIAAAGLFAEGATVPFVARYRKEATGGLDDLALENIHKKQVYFSELAERRDAILASISTQGQLTPELEWSIRAALSKQDLEDLYLPYKPRRRTKAQIARERGLKPLADALVASVHSRKMSATAMAQDFVQEDQGVPTVEAALEGARHIIAETIAEEASYRAYLRNNLWNHGQIEVNVVPKKEAEAQVYRDWFGYSEPVKRIVSHRLLAILRGERDGFLTVSITSDDENHINHLLAVTGANAHTECATQVALAIRDGYKRLLLPQIETEIRAQARERAESEAISVFRANLEALLLQSPFGAYNVVGLDPGIRTGCKLACVDGTGKVVGTGVIYPQMSPEKAAEATKLLTQLVVRFQVRAIAIGNGTGSRETDLFVRKCLKEGGLTEVIAVIVPETGASVYSASSVARDELPDMDVSLRGAVSIARRLQDPLAELVKIDPKSLGIGQYQHDVDEKDLAEELDRTVETAVNRVGAEVNSASVSLLRRVSGLNERTARALVKARDQNGPFSERKQLLTVSGIGPKTYELAAGFLRIRKGKNPLDATAVHPERYPVVERMASTLGVSIHQLIGNPDLIAKIRLDQFADAAQGIGKFTLADIKAELERPGRDPRPDFVAPQWREDVTSIDDVHEGLVLEGRVSNVTNFGAFVDLGIKRDGLIHLSELAHRWVSDPREIVQVGMVVKTKVIGVDRERGRVNLSMKALLPAPGPSTGQPSGRSGDRNDPSERRANAQSPEKTTLKDLTAKFNRK